MKVLDMFNICLALFEKFQKKTIMIKKIKQNNGIKVNIVEKKI